MGAWLHAPSTIRQRWVWPAASFTAVIPNFVGYIDISDLNAVFNNALRADGLDVRCFIEDVAAVLDRELVDTYNQGAQTGQLYVRFNASNAADTVMEIYGGAGDLVANDASTWTGAGYYNVLHNEEAAGNAVDSSGNYNGTNANVTYSQAGQIEDAYGHAANSYTDLGDVTELNSTQHFTMEYWVNQDADAVANTFPKWSAGQTRIQIYTPNSNKLVCRITPTDTNKEYGEVQNLTNFFTFGSWQHVVWIYDGTQPTNATRLLCYINGVGMTLAFGATGIVATTPNLAGVDCGWSDPVFGGFGLNGALDETRLNQNSLSTDFIVAQYDNQNNPGAFYTPGAVEYPPAPAGGPLPGESIMGIGLAMGMGV